VNRFKNLGSGQHRIWTEFNEHNATFL